MYLVFGATGNTGGVVARELLRLNEQVRVVVRDSARAEMWRAVGADVAAADMRAHSSSLDRAFDGVHAAYLICPPMYRAESVLEEHKRVNDVLATAVRRSGIPKVVVMSSIGAHDADACEAIQVFVDLEARIRETGAAASFVRPGYFMDNWRLMVRKAKTHGVLESFLRPLDGKFPMVSTHDVGLVAAAALREDIVGSRVIELAGPQEYSPNQVAVAMGKLLGKSLDAVAVSRDDCERMFDAAGVSKQYARMLIEMNEAFNDGTLVFESGNDALKRGEDSLDKGLSRFLAA